MGAATAGSQGNFVLELLSIVQEIIIRKNTIDNISANNCFIILSLCNINLIFTFNIHPFLWCDNHLFHLTLYSHYRMNEHSVFCLKVILLTFKGIQSLMDLYLPVSRVQNCLFETSPVWQSGLSFGKRYNPDSPRYKCPCLFPIMGTKSY